jgi:tRNA threonylcarbamoyladenosine biosynthesis protein TsaB
MKLLAIDTTTSTAVVGLHIDGKNYFSVSEESKRHNGRVLAAVDSLLCQNKLTIRDIDVFGVVTGPGSFTGIRLGVATVNAFGLAGNKPIVEITSLEQLDDGAEKLVLLDCRHNNFYAAKFGSDAEYSALSADEVNAMSINKEYLTAPVPEKIIMKCLEKAERGEFVSQAKPFYLKKSSAEKSDND